MLSLSTLSCRWKIFLLDDGANTVAKTNPKTEHLRTRPNTPELGPNTPELCPNTARTPPNTPEHPNIYGKGRWDRPLVCRY